jgi:N-acetylmuramoyl-L-alanine amidase
MKSSALCVAAACWIVPLLGQDSFVQLTAIDQGNTNGVAWVELHATKSLPDAKPKPLEDPPRIYIDLDGVKLAIGAGRNYKIEVNDGLLKGVHAFEDDTHTRVTFELTRNGSAQVQREADPTVLCIELHPGAGRPQPGADQRPICPGSALPAVSKNVSSPSSAPPTQPPVNNPPPSPPAVKAFPSLAGSMEIRDSKAAPSTDKTDSEHPKPEEKSIPPTPVPNNVNQLSLPRRILIDPGHGGKDYGASGRHGVAEKDVVLNVSRILAAMIRDRLGWETILTRTDDRFVPLEERTRIANEKRADLFLSIHANSSPSTGVSGVETYVLNFSNTHEALSLAERENAVNSMQDLQSLLAMIKLPDRLHESRQLAEAVQLSTYQASFQLSPISKNRGVKNAPLFVLNGAMMPAMLVELGFLSNPREEQLLNTRAFQTALAEGILEGLARMLDSSALKQTASRRAPLSPAVGHSGPK